MASAHRYTRQAWRHAPSWRVLPVLAGLEGKSGERASGHEQRHKMLREVTAVSARGHLPLATAGPNPIGVSAAWNAWAESAGHQHSAAAVSHREGPGRCPQEKDVRKNDPKRILRFGNLYIKENSLNTGSSPNSPQCFRPHIRTARPSLFELAHGQSATNQLLSSAQPRPRAGPSLTSATTFHGS